MKSIDSKDAHSPLVDVLAFLAFVLLAMALAFITSAKVHAAPAARSVAAAPAEAATSCEKSICCLGY